MAENELRSNPSGGSMKDDWFKHGFNFAAGAFFFLALLTFVPILVVIVLALLAAFIRLVA